MKYWVALVCALLAAGVHASDSNTEVSNNNQSNVVIGYEHGFYQENEGIEGSSDQLVIEYRVNQSFGVSAEFGSLGLEFDEYGQNVTLDTSVTQLFVNMYLPMNDTVTLTLGGGLWTAGSYEGCYNGYCVDVDAPSESITAQLGVEFALSQQFAAYVEWEALTYSDEMYENDNFLTLGINVRF